MPTETNTIHNDILETLNKKVEETSDRIEDIVESKCRDCQDGLVPVSGSVYDAYIRQIRKTVLSRFKEIKTWLGSYIHDALIQDVRTSGISRLHQIKEGITEAEAERQKVIEEQQSLFDNQNNLTDYEKYSLYGHPELKQSPKWKFWNRETINESEREVSANAELTYQKYRAKSRRSVLFGLIVTAICISIDFDMIYALFLSANYAANTAITAAFLSAAMLDAPPYVLGYIWTKNDDARSLFELQGNAGSSEAKRKIKGNKILLNIIFTVIVFAFLAYLVVRILSFLGGGDFNLAFHAILERDWNKIQNVEVNGAEFLSTVVPFATSVVALAVGKILYSARTDYIKESITVIKNEINEKIRLCDGRRIDCEKRIEDLKDYKVSLEREIWIFYLGRAPFPSDENIFRHEISVAFQKLSLLGYKQTYSNCCIHLRDQVTQWFQTINDRFAKYASDHSRISTMDLSQDEKNLLDDFWVISSCNEPQHEMTQSHLNLIEKIANDHLKQLN